MSIFLSALLLLLPVRYASAFYSLAGILNHCSVLFFFLLFQKELAKIITLEQGKTLADAEGDVFRGLRE